MPKFSKRWSKPSKRATLAPLFSKMALRQKIGDSYGKRSWIRTRITALVLLCPTKTTMETVPIMAMEMGRTTMETVLIMGMIMAITEMVPIMGMETVVEMKMVTAMTTETATESSADDKINQAGHFDLPDLFQPIEVWIGLA